jgi:hypothetical protein
LFALLARGNGLSFKVICTQGTISIRYYTIYNVNIIKLFDVECAIKCGKLGAYQTISSTLNRSMLKLVCYTSNYILLLTLSILDKKCFGLFQVLFSSYDHLRRVRKQLLNSSVEVYSYSSPPAVPLQVIRQDMVSTNFDVMH